VLVATFLLAVLAIPFPKKPGANQDSLPGLLGFNPSGVSDTSQLTSTAISSKYQGTGLEGDLGLSGIFPSSTRTKTSATSSSTTTTSASDVQPTSSANISTSTPSATSTARTTQADSNSDDSKTWKVVGVAVISMIAVALVIICVVFWERGTRFIRAVFIGKKRSKGVEDFVPDWEKRSWEVKLAEDNHQFPAIPSDSFNSFERAPSAQFHGNDEDDKRHPFPMRPDPVPVFANFVSPDSQGNMGPVENHSYSPMTTTEIQRQNSRAAQNAYTAYT